MTTSTVESEPVLVDSPQVPTVKFRTWYPTNASGRSPVVLWGNGTNEKADAYAPLLQRLASHGFIVIAVSDRPSGAAGVTTARWLPRGLDWLEQQNVLPTSPLAGRVDTSRVGVAGHSGGGAAAIMNDTNDPSGLVRGRVKTAVAIQPGPEGDASQLKGPALFLGSEQDGLLPAGDWGADGKAGTGDDSTAPWTLRGHFRQALGNPNPAELAVWGNVPHACGMNDGSVFQGPLIAWMSYHLKGDQQARGVFFGQNPEMQRKTGGKPLTEFTRNPAAGAR